MYRFKNMNGTGFLVIAFFGVLPFFSKAGDTITLARLEKPAVAFVTYYDDSLQTDVFYWELKQGKKVKRLAAYNFDGIEKAQTATLRALQLNGEGLPEIIVVWTFEAHHFYGAPSEIGPGEIGGGWYYNFSMVDVWDLDADSILFTAIQQYAQGNSETQAVLKDSVVDDRHTLDMVTRETNCRWQYEVTFNKDRSISLSEPVSSGEEIRTVNDIETGRTKNECAPDHSGGTFVLRRGTYVPKAE